MTTDRDKFLTEAMRGQRVPAPDNWRCGATYALKNAEGELFCPNCERIYFSDWEGFGKLWEWVQQQPWWAASNVGVTLVHPDRFADAVYQWLKALR